MESTASTFTVEIEGEKKHNNKNKIPFSSPIGIRIGKLQQPRSILAENRVPHPGHATHSCQINHITSVTTRMVSSTPPGRQAGSLRPSLAPVCLSLSLSLPPPAVCKHPPYSSLSNILVALVLLLLPKATLSSLLLLAFRCRSSLSSHLLSRLLWFLFLSFLSLLLVFFLRIPSSDSEFRTHAA